MSPPSIKTPIDYSSDYTQLHPNAKASDFHPNGKLLSEGQITALKNRLAQFNEDARYSKLYLQNLGININRGGIIRLYNETAQKYELFAVYKEAITQKAISLGQGGFGKVKLIQNLETGEFKAMKVLCRPEHKNAFEHEAQGLHKLHRGDRRVLKKKLAAGQMENGKLCLIQDLAPGKNLYEVLHSGILTPAERFDVMQKILTGIQELHTAGMLHRDIKIENIMYDTKTKTLTIIDIGLWQTIGERDYRICGTRGRIAPEIFQGHNYSTASDVFAVGRIFQEMFGLHSKDTSEKKFGYLDKQAHKHLSHTDLNNLKRLTQKLLFSTPGDRPSLAKIGQELQAISMTNSLQSSSIDPSGFSPLAAVNPQPHFFGPSSLPPLAAANPPQPAAPLQQRPKVKIEKTPHALAIQYNAVSKQLDIINEKIGPKTTKAVADIEVISTYAQDLSSRNAKSKSETTEIKNKTLDYARDTLTLFTEKKITFPMLYGVFMSLHGKLENLPHFGTVSSFIAKHKDKPKPSDSAVLLYGSLTAFEQLLETDMDTLNEDMEDARALNEEQMIACENKALLIEKQQTIKAEKISYDLTVAIINNYANNPPHCTTQKDTDRVKKTILTMTIWMIEQFQTNKITLDMLCSRMSVFSSRVNALPHFGKFSKQNVPSATARLMQDCVNSFRSLLVEPDNIRQDQTIFLIPDALNYLKMVLDNQLVKGAKFTVMRDITIELEHYFKNDRNPLNLTNTLNLIEEFNILPAERTEFDRPRIAYEKIINHIDQCLRGKEKVMMQEQKQSPAP